MNIKNIFVRLVLLLCICSCNNPHTIAGQLSGLEIPDNAKVEFFKRESESNGDNETLIVLNIDSMGFEKIKNTCVNSDYSPLPVKNYISGKYDINKYIDDSQDGIYKFKSDVLDAQHTLIVALDFKSNRLIIYSLLW